MKFTKFTDPDGQPIYLVSRWVTKVRAPLPGRHAVKARTLIYMGGAEQAVQETLDQVLKILEAEPPDV